MPELPELEILKDKLTVQVKGKKIKNFQVLKPHVLKNFFEGELSNETINNIVRRGKYLIFGTDKHSIIIHLMLHGFLRFSLPTVRPRKSANALIVFVDGTALELYERGHKKRMSLYIIPKNKSLARIDSLGIEPLDKHFNVDKLKQLLESDAQQLKTFLRNQQKIAGIGNAYADEILWMAGLSPFKLSTNLSKGEIEKLHRSIVGVLEWAIQHVTKAERLDDRSFLRIHGKKGGSCPRCGGRIRTVSFSQADTFYCPECQTAGKRLKDRRMSKFYR